MKNYIASITVTYNPNLTVLEKQMYELSSQVDQVILVDNGSNNIECINKIVSKYEKAMLIALSDNFGIAYAQNRGVEKAIENNSSHIILFDHDSMIGENFISSLLDLENKLLESGKNVGAIGPSFRDTRTKKIYNPIKSKKTFFLNGAFMDKIILDECNSSYVEPYFIIASGCLIRTNVINQIGMMKEELFIDTVDTEWCFRAKKAEYDIFMATKVIMDHTVGDDRKSFFGKQFSIHSDLRRYYNMRNNLLFLNDTSFTLGRKIRIILMLFARFILGAFYCKSLSKYIEINFKAVKDFFNGKLGKY